MVMVLDEVPAGSKGRACVYSRVSNPNDTREHSLDTQEERTVAVLRKMGYTVGTEDIFRERHTGTEYDRPVLNRVRDLIAMGTYQAIGFYAMDRISRSQVHTAILFDEFERSSVLPVSATEDISDNSPEGKLIRSIRAYVAEVERIKILDRTARAREKLRANRQMLMTSRAKFGYRYDKKLRRRLIDTEERKIVELIFEWCAAGVACNAIAKRLTEQGVANSTARRGYKNRTSFSAWSGSTIQTIIRDKTYLGWTIENRYQLVKNPKSLSRKGGQADSR